MPHNSQTDMKKLSIGKIRGLQELANDDGVFNICAMDHRRSMMRIMEGGHVVEGSTGYEEMSQRKLELCNHLAPHASAVLLDPLFGAAQSISHSALPKSTGLLVSLEASGYSGHRTDIIKRVGLSLSLSEGIMG